MDIRMYDSLPPQVEDQIWDMRDEALGLLATDAKQAEHKLAEAWSLIPDPKFNWGIAGVTLHDYTAVLNLNGRMELAASLLTEEITDLEASGHKIIDANPYIRLAETALLQGDANQAIACLKKAYAIGKIRGLQGEPKLYREIALGKMSGEQEIMDQFAALDIYAPLRQP